MKQQKRITDPIHGSIFLTDIEADIVSSKCFQRLHNIRQLGLAHLIFPGANYSRFSHSIGACHNVSKMLSAVRANSTEKVIEDAAEIEQALRLGALLHDIGHYPFSHATEHVIQNFYSRNKVERQGDKSDDSKTAPLTQENGINHEQLGRKILDHDPELKQIFAKHNFDINKVKSIFSKEDPDNTLVEMISSDLDCDRLDYLRRTAHHTGLPYGSVDTEFLTNQARLDNEKRYCLAPKAARAADHLLISRFYDYLQVPFNKTVCALEWSLITSIQALLENGLKCSEDEMIKRIASGQWHLFDDNYFFGKFRVLRDETTNNPVLKDHLTAILERKPAAVIASYDDLLCRNAAKSSFNQKKQDLEKIVENFAKENSIDPARLFVKAITVNFAKYSMEEAIQGYAEGAIRILDEETGDSTALCTRSDSLLGKLLGQDHKGLKVFYLAQNDRKEIAKKLNELLKNQFNWPITTPST